VPLVTDGNHWTRRFRNTCFRGEYRGEWARHNLVLAEAALAVRLYRLARGRYPERLEDSPGVAAAGAGRRVGPAGGLPHPPGADPSSHLQDTAGALVFGKLAASHWRER
jgi:hypothetical protein